jgi:hypothetical protein
MLRTSCQPSGELYDRLGLADRRERVADDFLHDSHHDADVTAAAPP